MDNIGSIKIAKLCAYDEEGNLLAANMFERPVVLGAGDDLNMTWNITVKPDGRGHLVMVTV